MHWLICVNNLFSLFGISSFTFIIYLFCLFNSFEKNTWVVLPAYLLIHFLAVVLSWSSSTAVWPPRWLNGSVTSESSSTSRWSALHGRLSARLSRGWLESFLFLGYGVWLIDLPFWRQQSHWPLTPLQCTIEHITWFFNCYTRVSTHFFFLTH